MDRIFSILQPLSNRVTKEKKNEKDVDTDLDPSGSIDPDKYYTLYGDSTTVRYDAPSSEKLYIKLESDQFYAMFGDYNTDFTVTELSQYNRSLTGLKTEFNSDKINVKAFAAETNQAFIKDEIQGNGTSGLYNLSNKNIVLNSDKVIIEVRDRFKSEVIIESRQLNRYTDYTLDPVDGTIYFREPIYSRDQNFNPVYIVVDYEVAGNVDNEITAGARVSYKHSDTSPEVGATVIHEGTSGSEADLYGADIKYKLNNKTTVKLEAATSEKASAGNTVDGNAYLAEVDYQTPSVDSKVYLRQQEAGFGLGQQSGSETGTRKLGADIRSKIKDDINLNAEFMRQENLNTEATRSVLGTTLERSSGDYAVGGGILMARDEFANGEKQESKLLTANARRKFLDNKLEARTAAEFALDNAENSDYPTRLLGGAAYDITPNAQIFAEQEFSIGERQDTQMTRAGVKSTPWENATLQSSVENQSSEYGPRTFANMGLTQGFRLNDEWRLDFGLERSHTIREPGNTPFNVNVPPASGTTNNDFTAINAGATYRKNDWSFTSRAEYRTADLEDKYGLLAGFYHEARPGFGMSSVLRYYETDRTNGIQNISLNAEFSLAYRPISSQWIILDKFKFTNEEESGGSESFDLRKYINNFAANYLHDRRNQIAFNHGIKYTEDRFDGEKYSGTTQLFGTEYRHDIDNHWDVGIQASLLTTDVGNTDQYSYGASLGHSFAENVWISVGVNLQGFTDSDFSAAKYTTQGFYVKFRFAIDHYTSRKFMAWWEK